MQNHRLCAVHLHRIVATLLASALLSAGISPAFGLDNYNLTTRQLTIASLTIGSVAYTNLVVTVGSIDTPPSGAAPYHLQDLYSPPLAQLYVAEVTVGTKTYYNAEATITGLVSVGSAEGADSYSGGVLNLPVIRVGSTVYQNVSVTVGSVVSSTHDMPRFGIDTYDPGSKQLSMSAVFVGSTLYTNVVVTVKNINSIGASYPITHLWSDAVQIAQSSSDPIIASDPSSGAFYLGWTVYDAATEKIMIARYTDAEGLAPPSVVFLSGGIIAGLAFDGQGKGYAVWSGENTDGTGLMPYQGLHAPGAGGWGTELIDSSTTSPPGVLPVGGTQQSSVQTLGISVASDGIVSAPILADYQFTEPPSTANPTGLSQEVGIYEAGVAPGQIVISVAGVDPVSPSASPTPIPCTEQNGNSSYIYPKSFSLPSSAVASSTLPGRWALIYSGIQNTLQSGCDTISTVTQNLIMHLDAAHGVNLQLSSYTVGGGDETSALAIGLVQPAEVAFGTDGSILVTWAVATRNLTDNETKESAVTVYAARYVNGIWQRAQPLASAQNPDPGNTVYSNMEQPAAALDADGNGMIVYAIYGQEYMVTFAAGDTSYGAPVAMGAVSFYHRVLSLQADSVGNAFLLEADGSPNASTTSAQVRYRDRRSAAWDPPALSFVALSDQDPVMAMDRNGQPMVVWPAFIDSRGNVGVYASRYE
jgi:hypothetical protein